MAERPQHVTIPLMVRREDDLQFVEDDVDTVSDNDVSSGSVTRNSTNLEGNIYYEIPTKESKVEFLGIPKFLHSRSNSSPSNSSAQTSPMLERKLSSRKKSNHDYEKLSVNSNSSKRSTVERIAGSFRRRDATHEKKAELKGEEEEHVLETKMGCSEYSIGTSINSIKKRKKEIKVLLTSQYTLEPPTCTK
ncbi:uncharacterized protein CDAR_385371 [Caerostris darwini]|uniref:Uncharacterized protein n=1 Tax=Caerostris darwini TaxID=1538125 RepID=A0AAV4PEC1_9ARAC|nr:uncharacterized protein CDAR_385371 [Caerostris darwini]